MPNIGITSKNNLAGTADRPAYSPERFPNTKSIGLSPAFYSLNAEVLIPGFYLASGSLW